MATNLHFDITGDCTGALTALSNTQNAVERLSSTTAGVAVRVHGSSDAVTSLQSVGAAAMAVNGVAAAINFGSGNIGEVRDNLAGLRGDVESTARSFGGISAADIFGGGGDARQLVGALSGGFQEVAASAGAANGELRSTSGATLSLAEGNAELAGTSDVAAERLAHLNTQFQQAEMGANRLKTAVGAPRGGGVSGAVDDLASEFNRINGAPDLKMLAAIPPPDFLPPDLGGGGGGGGGGGPRIPRGGRPDGDEAKFKPGELLGALGAPAMMGTMLGVASAAVTGAVGVMAVAEAIKKVPALAYAANQAMVQFDKGIRSAALGATQDGVPALHDLGSALRPLGSEIGRVGAQNMGTTLTVASDLASTATMALKNMEPAIGPAIKGLGSLGDALLQGISSPEAVAGIRAVGDALADPQTKQGIADTVSGIVGASTIITKVVADISGAIDQATGGGPEGSTAVTAGFGGALLGKSLLGDLFGGGFAGGATGLAVGGGLAAAGFGAASYEETHGAEQAVTPGILGNIGGAILGGLVTGGNPLGIVGGGIAGNLAMSGSTLFPGKQGVRAEDTFGGFLGGALTGAGIGLAFDGIGAIPGAIIGGGIGAMGGDVGANFDTRSQVGGPELDASGFPKDQGPGKYGWSVDSGGNLVPNNQRPPTPAQQFLQREQTQHTADQSRAREQLKQSMPPPPGPHLTGMGPGSSVGVLTPQQANALGVLNQGAGSAAQNVNQLQQSSTNAAQTIQQLGSQSASAHPQTQQLSQSLSQMQQPLQQLQHPMQQLQQSSTQAAQQMQSLAPPPMPQLQMPQMPNLSASLAPLQAFKSQAAQQMQQAQGDVQSTSQQMGTQIPQSMSQGIQKNTPAACDAAAKMAESSKKCAKSAVGAQSPARAFIELGENSGQGLAIGFGNSTGLAANAAGDMMSAVSAGLLHSNSGLAVGFAWGRNVVTGIDSVIRSADFTSAGLPDVGSRLAKTILGQAGLLGSAGSGAAIYNVTSGNQGLVNMPAPVVNIENHVQVGDTPVQVVAQKVVTKAFDQVKSSLGRQKG